ncbi:MAG: hypothetical protein ACKO2P_08530, partial [Planctomycetota bacterium]
MRFEDVNMKATFFEQSYADFSLTAPRNGQSCRKIRGKVCRMVCSRSISSGGMKFKPDGIRGGELVAVYGSGGAQSLAVEEILNNGRRFLGSCLEEYR